MESYDLRCYQCKKFIGTLKFATVDPVVFCDVGCAVQNLKDTMKVTVGGA